MTTSEYCKHNMFADRCLACEKEKTAHLPKVTCPTCHGDGNGRGIERGMGCTVCHGHGEVDQSHAKFIHEVRNRSIAKYGF